MSRSDTILATLTGVTLVAVTAGATALLYGIRLILTFLTWLIVITVG